MPQTSQSTDFLEKEIIKKTSQQNINDKLIYKVIQTRISETKVIHKTKCNKCINKAVHRTWLQ